MLADTRLTEPENPENANSMVLLAAAWLTGEYCSLLDSPEEALELLSQKSTAKLDPAIQATYLQSILKIFAFWMNSLQDSWNEETRQALVTTVDSLREGVEETFSRSPDLEVQERVRSITSDAVVAWPLPGMTVLSSASGQILILPSSWYCRLPTLASF